MEVEFFTSSHLYRVVASFVHILATTNLWKKCLSALDRRLFDHADITEGF
jgi:hypothetical protein